MNEQRIKTAFEMQPSWRSVDYPMFRSGYLCAMKQMENDIELIKITMPQEKTKTFETKVEAERYVDSWNRANPHSSISYTEANGVVTAVTLVSGGNI